MRLFITLFSIIFILSGCVKHTKMIKAMPEEKMGNLNIQKVAVSYSDLSSEKIIALDEQVRMEAQEESESESLKYQPLKIAFARVAQAFLDTHDAENELHADIEIEVDNLKFSNPLATILISDVDQLSGSVRVIDSKTKELYSEFYIDVLEVQGGLLDLAIRGGGVREKLATKFAKRIGENLGFKKID